MSVLSLPVVFSQSTSPCLEHCCIFRRARFLRETRARCARCRGAALHLPSARRPLCQPAVVLEALLEAPPLLLRGLPAA